MRLRTPSPGRESERRYEAIAAADGSKRHHATSSRPGESPAFPEWATTSPTRANSPRDARSMARSIVRYSCSASVDAACLADPIHASSRAIAPERGSSSSAGTPTASERSACTSGASAADGSPFLISRCDMARSAITSTSPTPAPLRANRACSQSERHPRTSACAASSCPADARTPAAARRTRGSSKGRRASSAIRRASVTSRRARSIPPSSRTLIDASRR
mmetsp:Transcript_30215/g.71873  ORF Transcript_30215/g.71873 Transcript_30215/m.71873 type:complete len:221 (+) Transcript_30215:121-783(+)